MIKRAVDISLRRRSLFLALAAGLALFAVTQLSDARVENLPEFNPPFVEVQTEALGLSAYEVEQLITVPLEADLLNGVAFVQDIRSQSMPSLSSIVMIFEPGTDILDARQLVQERLTQAAGLPNVSRAPAMVQPLSSESRVMMVGLTSDELTPVELGVLARWTIRPKLMGVDGVANVAVWGQREQQLQVQVDPEALAANNVKLTDVVNTTGNALWVTPLTFLEASTPGVGGFIDGPNQRIGIRHVPAISTPADLASVAIDGHPELTLGDVATIVEDHQQLIGDAVVGEAGGLYMVVEKFPWSNTTETTNAIEAAMDDLAPGLTGVTVNTDLFRPANYLERAVGNLGSALVVATVLVAVALLFLLRGWREGLTALLSMIASVMLATSVLFVLDATFHSVMLAGIAIGTLMIIDDSVRNSYTNGSHHANDGWSIAKRLGANSESFVYSAVVMTVLFVPTIFMDGAAGSFLPRVGLAMAVALVSAFIVALSITPALSSLLLPSDASEANELDAEYGSFISGMLSKGTMALGIGAAMLLIGALLVPTLDREFIPNFQQTDLVVSLDAAAGVSLQETRRIAGNMSQELAALPGVEQSGAQVGRAILSDEVTNVNSSEVWLTIDSDADYDATFDAVREVVDGYPGFGRPTINTYSNDRVVAQLQTTTDDLVVRVYGEEPVQLRELAAELRPLVNDVDGVENARAIFPVTQPSIEIEVDLDRAADLQIKPGDVRRAAATLLSGIEVGSLFEQQRVFEVVVWSAPEVRDSKTSVENLQIDSPSGESVRLGDVAAVTVRPNDRIIERDAVSRYIDIVADIPGGDVTGAEDQIRALVAERGLPFEYHVGFASDRADDAANGRQVIAVGIAVLVSIFLLLQAAFTSFRLAALVIVSAIASVVGSIVAVRISGGTYSIGSLVGMLAIAGLSLRAAMALMKRYEDLQLDQHMPLDGKLIAEGARRNFRPTVASLTSVGAFSLPFVISGTPPGLEVIGPIAVAVLGGVFTSAIVTLGLLPITYNMLAKPAVPHESFKKAIIDLDSDSDTSELVTS